MRSLSLLLVLLALLALYATGASLRAQTDLELFAEGESDSESDADVDVEVEHESEIEDAAAHESHVEVEDDGKTAPKCIARGGSCMSTQACSAAKGQSFAGLCPGAASFQCCVVKAEPTPPTPAPTPDAKSFASPKCTAKGGLCMDVNACPGVGGQAFASLCPGAANVQCCVKNWVPQADRTPPGQYFLMLDGKLQRLRVLDAATKSKIHKEYIVSTGAGGWGMVPEQATTPYGNFNIAAKQAKAARPGEIIESRRPTGVISRETDKSAFMTTRILALEGLDKLNRNTAARGILIHGTNRERKLGVPASHGCIRMFNKDVIELFDMLTVNTKLYIGVNAFAEAEKAGTKFTWEAGVGPAQPNPCGSACK